jgi:hypothetical protein
MRDAGGFTGAVGTGSILMGDFHGFLHDGPDHGVSFEGT